jgi:alkylation response protein AidB-like acyl-CoA dehydrogenase
MREYGIERAVRDARLGLIGGGADEIMKEIVGKTMGLQGEEGREAVGLAPFRS